VIESTTINTNAESIVEIDLIPLISDPENNLDLNSFEITEGPSSDALAFIDGDGVLIINYEDTFFNGTDQIEIQACDLQGSCTQQIFTIHVGENSAALIIYNGISVNADGMNAIWRIQNVELFDNTRNNEVTIYNRWGDEVYAESNYDNVDRVFTGKSKSGSDLPSGTYFYRIEFKGGLTAKTGFLVLKR
jgi:gliding motility-associated-like protein